MIAKLALATALLLVVPSARADWEIIQKTNAGGQEKQVTIKIKDDRIRNDVGTDVTILIDGKDGSAEMYMHAQKMKVRVDAAMMQGVGALAAKFAGGDEPAAKPKATGEKAKLGAWDAEIYTWESKLGSGKFYVVKDFPKFAELNQAMDKTAKSMNNPLAGMFPKNTEFPGMVVKTEMTIMGQQTASELVSATEKEINADDFKAPDGYQEMKMPAIPGGLGK